MNAYILLRYQIAILFMQQRLSYQQQVKQIVNSSKNSEKVNELMVKMGRVLSKKRQLHQQHPVLVYQDRIWLGNYAFASNKQFLSQNNIKTVVSCLQLSLTNYFPDISYKQFKVKDVEDTNFTKFLNDFYSVIANSQGNVLIHCFSGVSRSSAFLLAYIMKRQRINYQSALAKLRAVYQLASPNTYFQKQLISLEQTLQEEPIKQNYDLLGVQDISVEQPDPKIQQQTQEISNSSSLQTEDILSGDKDQSSGLLIQTQTNRVQASEQKQVSPNKSPLKQEKQQINLLDDYHTSNQTQQNATQIPLQSNKSETRAEVSLLEQSTSFSLQQQISMIDLGGLSELKSRKLTESSSQMLQSSEQSLQMLELAALTQLKSKTDTQVQREMEQNLEKRQQNELGSEKLNLGAPPDLQSKLKKQSSIDMQASFKKRVKSEWSLQMLNLEGLEQLKSKKLTDIQHMTLGIPETAEQKVQQEDLIQIQKEKLQQKDILQQAKVEQKEEQKVELKENERVEIKEDEKVELKEDEKVEIKEDEKVEIKEEGQVEKVEETVKVEQELKGQQNNGENPTESTHVTQEQEQQFIEKADFNQKKRKPKKKKR